MYFLPDKSGISKDYTGGKVEIIITNRYRTECFAMKENRKKMKPKAKIKLAVDLLMTVVLLFLMGYQLWGDAAHEWAGAGMLVLFIAHHLLNLNWHKGLFRGKYTAARILMNVIDLALFIAMFCLMASGIIMSRHVFAFLPIDSGMGIARLMHMAVCFCDKRSGDLYVSENTVRFSGL